MSTDHPKALRDYLVAQGMSSTKVFAGPAHRGAPKDGVFIVPTGGPPPQSFFGDPQTLKFPSCQLMVVGGVGKHQDAHAQAIIVYDHLENATNLSGYLIVQMLQPQPLFLGVDNDDRARYTVNVQCEIKE